MKPHVRIFLEHFGFIGYEYIPCECGCGGRVVDVHHLSPRGMGGSKKKDTIENLVGLTRECHERAERDKAFNNKIKERHLRNVQKKYIYSKTANFRN